MDEPWLGDTREDAAHEHLEDDLAHDVPLCLWLIILCGETRFQDVVDGLAYVHDIDDALWRDGHMRLHLVKELGESGCASGRVGSMELSLSITVICPVLIEQGRQIAEDERGEVCSNETGLKSAKDMGEDASYFWEELLVVTGDLCPPGIDVGS